MVFQGPMAGDQGRARCATGIEGLDSILGGGFPVGSMVLVTGVPGVGKTSLSLEFAIRGAAAGDRTLYITTIERPEKLLASVPDFEFFRSELIDDGLLRFIEVSELLELDTLFGRPESREDVLRFSEGLSKYIDENGISRLVIDSYSAMFHALDDRGVSRDLLLMLSEMMYRKGCTAVLVADVEPSSTPDLAVTATMESIIADGVIVLGNHQRRSDLLRTLQVLKMKGASHSRSKYVIDLTSCGILITPLLRGGA